MRALSRVLTPQIWEDARGLAQGESTMGLPSPAPVEVTHRDESRMGWIRTWATAAFGTGPTRG
jgi:hypothetical protein